MARVTVMPNGCTASVVRQGPNPNPSERGECKGWTPQVTRRLRRWLYSVDGSKLGEGGFTTTNTVLHLPPTPQEWRDTLRLYFDRLRYEGLERLQYLTEFQKRGVPHLHTCGFGPWQDPQEREKLLKDHWLAVAAPWAPEKQSQWVNDLWGLRGWFQYQAKHSARGVKHYQRANLPEGWRSRSTGRMWGVLGEWPTHELQLDVDHRTFVRFRRNVQRWLIAQARTEEKAGWEKRLTWLRRMLQDPDPKRAAVRPIGEFVPGDTARKLLIAALHDDSSGSVGA